MKTLVFWSGGSVSAARARASARFVLWDETREAELRAAGVAYRAASSYLEPGGGERIEQAAIAWTKAWGLRPLVDGRSLRELLAWDGTTLWWWAELYLHHSTEATRYVRLIELATRVLEAEAPDEAECLGLPADEALLVRRACTAWRVLVHGPAPRLPKGVGRRLRSVARRARVDLLKTLLAALKARLLGAPRAPGADDARRRVALLSHAAFWRARPDESGGGRAYEHYFDRLIPALDEQPDLRPVVVAVGPRSAFRRRGTAARLREWLRLSPDAREYLHVQRYTTLGVFRETRAALRAQRALWRALRGSPGLRESLAHSGVSFADLAAPDVAATLLLQLPWAVRSQAEARAMLRAQRPAALCLYAESSGWGRAALHAARREGVPSVALQHGILYPTYFSYLHPPGEEDCPRPDLSAVFGEAARSFLVERGGYPQASLRVTGSPKFDELLAAAGRRDRAALRARLGVGEGEALVVLASRFRPIRPTHQAVGRELPGFVRALEATPGVTCLIKPHPAEPAEPYAAVLRALGAARARVLPPASDLIELLLLADALVTVESLSAVEALVLDRPVLVLGMPTNLRELVEAGAALGVEAGADPQPALRALLFDDATRDALEQARARYRQHVAGGLDGRATERLVELLREAARRGAAPDA